MNYARTLVEILALAALLLIVPLTAGCPAFPPCTTDPVEGVYVNIQVDAEEDDTAGLARMIDALNLRDIKTTVYVTGDYANRNASRILGIFRQGHEIALHGYYTGEQLGSMTKEEQLDLLTRAKKALEGCQPCGTSIPITGFRPQYFSQNEDTYAILDELGFTYDSGFKVGVPPPEGHEADFAPYPMPDHSFYAIPITTVDYGSDTLYLCDIGSAQGAGLTGAEWDDLLQTALEEAIENHRPLVVLFHGWYTGNKDEYDYWQPFLNFLDAARCKVTFVTSQELVELFAD